MSFQFSFWIGIKCRIVNSPVFLSFSSPAYLRMSEERKKNRQHSLPAGSMQLKTQGNVSLAVACSCTFPDTMATAGVWDNGETTELENPPASLKSLCGNILPCPVTELWKLRTKVKHVGSDRTPWCLQVHLVKLMVHSIVTKIPSRQLVALIVALTSLLENKCLNWKIESNRGYGEWWHPRKWL